MFDREAEQERLVADSLDIELWGAWSAHHCVERVVAGLEGGEGPFVQRVSPDR